MDPIVVAALYQFTPIADCAAVRQSLADRCRAEQVKGTLLIAAEGINGTIAGAPEAITRVIDHIRAVPGCGALEPKFSGAAVIPFRRLKVRIKREIVTMGLPQIDPLGSAGTYVTPQHWNALITDPDTVVIDTRNDYEVAIGTFAGAIDPQIATFRDFPAWFAAQRARLLGENKAVKVAMFCTGGIRCEKSTAFLKAEGVEEVFHLQGGILKYLETVPASESLFQGECFVFDRRVAVGQGLSAGSYGLCHACRRPVNAEDCASKLYETGVSCPACYHDRSDDQRARYRERHHQEMLAKAQGQAHIGANHS